MESITELTKRLVDWAKTVPVPTAEELERRKQQRLKESICAATDAFKENVKPRVRQFAVPQEQIERVLHHDSGDKKGFYFWGISGCGKSVLLYNLGCYLLQKSVYKHIVWLDCPVFDSKIIEISKKFGDVYTIVQKYMRAEALFVDDITQQNISKNGKATLQKILDYREGHLKPTYITANGDIHYLAQMYDVASASRIRGMCTLLHIPGGDRR